MTDWTRWQRTETGGYELIPPRRCPTCARYWPTRGDRPTERHMGCSCATVERGGHTLWICPACDTHAAEGCSDVARWHSATTPVGLPPELRATVRARADEE